MRMTAALLFEQGRARPYASSGPLTVAEVELDPPGPGEVLVEVAAAGLCHSDLSAINGSVRRPVPIVPGHEGAGVVREVGPGVSGLCVGDHVVGVFGTGCGGCRYCVRGKPNLCVGYHAARAAGTLSSGGVRLRLDGAPVHHSSGLSLFAQYAVVERASLVRVERDVPLADAALFGCAVMTGAGAVFHTAALRPGDTVGVVGLGGVGMCALLASVAGGAGRVVAVDTQEHKLALARDLGATDTFLATDEDCAEQVREATGGGLESVVEAAGNPAAMRLAYAITDRGGCTVTAGLPATGAQIPLGLAELVKAEKQVKGSYMGGCHAERDLPRLIELYRRGRLPVHRLRSGDVTFDTINTAFDHLADQTALRQILRPHA